MGGLSSLRTAGHTGYTGTSLVIDFASRSFVILLTNRVHPVAVVGVSVNPARVAAAQGLAESLAVRPREGRTAWFSGTANARTATLTVPLPATPRPLRLSWQQFVDTEASDPLTLQVSGDGGHLDDAPLPARCGDRRRPVRDLRTAPLAVGVGGGPGGHHGRALDLRPGCRPVRPRDLPGRHHPSGTGAGSWSTPSTIPTGVTADGWISPPADRDSARVAARAE